MLGIVILNYNTWQESVACVDSIEKHLQETKYTIYLVDNQSKIRPTREQLDRFENAEYVKVIFSEKNGGYSAGNNIGIKAALDDQCDQVLICNSDILIVDDSLSKMISFIENNLNVGIVGPQVFNKRDEFQPFYMMSKLTAIGKIQNMMLKTPLKGLCRGFESRFIYNSLLTEPRKTFGVSGCCFMMSRECAQFLYPLDERTFLYEEEYIIGAKLENSPFEVFIIPDTHIIHAHGASTGGISAFSYQCLIDSEQLYLKEYLHSNVILRKAILAMRMILKRRYVK